MAGTIRVLHVLGTLDMGGAESRIMDIYRHIDRERVQFDFLVHTKSDGSDDSSDHLTAVRSPQFYDEEVGRLGGRIYCLPRFTGKNFFRYRKACEAFFAAHHGYAAVDGHMTSLAAVYLPIAKRAGIPVTIAHARSAGVDPGIRGLVTRIFRRGLPKAADLLFTCSAPAAASVYGKSAGRAILVPNALEVRRFAFDAEVRKRVRAELGLSPSTVLLGHGGRFDEMKNQAYLAGLVPALRETGKDFAFCMIGEGKLLADVRNAFEAAGAKAFLPGQQDRQRTIDLYQAFDAFVFPSLYEGLPGTVIEAQAAGIPCIIADTITDEVCITELVSRLPLERKDLFVQEIGKAAELVLAGTEEEREEARTERSRAAIGALGRSGYDAEALAMRLCDFYTSLLEKPCAESADILRKTE